MTPKTHTKTIILGSGPAGLTAAIYAARANISTRVITGSEVGGQITLTAQVDNYPGFPDGISGYELAELFKAQALRFNIELVYNSATSVIKKDNFFLVTTDHQNQYTCEALIVACGCSKRLSNIQGESELFGYGVSSCATCDGMFYKNKITVVLGGGNTACKDALFLTKHASKVLIINPENELNAQENLVQEIKENEKIEVLNQTKIIEIKGTKVDGVTEVITNNSKRSIIKCDGVFISTGFKPNSELFTDLLELDEKGYIKTETASTKAKNIDGVFICGDIRSGAIHQLVTATGSACQAIIEVNNFLKEKH